MNSPDLKAADEAEAQTPSQALSGRVSRGLGWTSFGSVAIQLMSLLRSAVLARLLLQADFGLMGMAATVTGALSVLTNTGMGSSIVSSQFSSDAKMHRHVNTVWTVEVGRGALLSALLWIGATPTALFYQEPRLAPMLSVLSITPLLSSLNNIGLSLLARGVQIGRVTQFSLLSNTANLLITLALAWWWRSVWALVWGQVAGSAISLALSYCFHPYRPRFLIDREALRNAFQFGKWMFVIGVMVYITTTVDNIFVGKLLGAQALGPYVLAYTIANLPSTLVGQIFGTVFFPAFAELGRGQIERLEAAVERTFQIGAALLLLISLPLALFAHEIVGVVFGSRWGAAARATGRFGFSGTASRFYSDDLAADYRPQQTGNRRQV
jgi:O-antigen/teichoic acid export membrane protein